METWRLNFVWTIAHFLPCFLHGFCPHPTSMLLNHWRISSKLDCFSLSRQTSKWQWNVSKRSCRNESIYTITWYLRLNFFNEVEFYFGIMLCDTLFPCIVIGWCHEGWITIWWVVLLDFCQLWTERDTLNPSYLNKKKMLVAMHN